jgi:hypothetical protein
MGCVGSSHSLQPCSFLLIILLFSHMRSFVGVVFVVDVLGSCADALCGVFSLSLAL